MEALLWLLECFFFFLCRKIRYIWVYGEFTHIHVQQNSEKWALHAFCFVALLDFHCPLAAFNGLSKEKSALKYLM